MGMLGNSLNNAAAEAAARQREMQILLRGKNSEQQAIIKFFYGRQAGCMSSNGVTVDAYCEKVKERLAKLDTKSMALNKLGIEEEEVQEIAPVVFEGYIFNNKTDNLVTRDYSNSWISSDYMITWLFFGEQEVFVYQYSFSMISDSKKENTMQYFYQDITNFTASSETYQKMMAEVSGCNDNTQYMQVSANADEFKIVVPGDTLHCSMTPTDDTEAAIRGMRNKLREMKHQ